MKKIKISLKYKIMFIVIIILIVSYFVKITKIEVIGNKYHTNDEIINILYKDKFSRISLYSFIKNNILKIKHNIPNVEEIDIIYKSPISVVINVYEKPIIGYIRYINDYYYFDEDLYVLEINAKKDYRYMEIVGITIPRNDLYSYLRVDNKNIAYIIKAISRYRKDVGMSIENINFSKSSEIMIEGNGQYVNIGNGDNIEEKMSLLIDIYPKIEKLHGTLDLSKVKTRYDKGEYIFKKR